MNINFKDYLSEEEIQNDWPDCHPGGMLRKPPHHHGEGAFSQSSNNKMKINLVQDQAIHVAQIIITAIILL